MKTFRILVFPCGSEIGLELQRALRYSRHVDLIGGSSVKDHGIFAYENYLGDLPFVDSPQLVPALQKLVSEHRIDGIYPAMDNVLYMLKQHEQEIGCKVISSPAATAAICLSKRKTYKHLHGIVRLPTLYETSTSIPLYPVFVKPDIGYGSRGTFVARSAADIQWFFSKSRLTNYVICEFLPGQEYTVDCFTNRHGRLIFSGSRLRSRISNGISVNTRLADASTQEFTRMAQSINERMAFQGAWFFQVKRGVDSQPKLLEVASRLAGSSAVHRAQGVNLALLSVFDAFGFDVEIMPNKLHPELDRALGNQFRLDVSYGSVYVDFDDCLLISQRINTLLVRFLFQCLNQQKEIVLISRHEGDLSATLKRHRLEGIFDKVHHLSATQHKWQCITRPDAIFIDDSHAERKDVALHCNIPVFSPDMVESLLDNSL